MSVTWLEEEGCKILYSDFRGAKEKEIFEQLFDHFEAINSSLSKVLVLMNLNDTQLSEQFFEEFKNLYHQYQSKKIRKIAILGLNGVYCLILKKYFSDINKRSISCHKNEDEAKLWLVNGYLEKKESINNLTGTHQ